MLLEVKIKGKPVKTETVKKSVAKCTWFGKYRRYMNLGTKSEKCHSLRKKLRHNNIK